MSASAKTGGNKKTASPSDIAYQARRKAGGRDAINKAKRIARHNKLMAKAQAKAAFRKAHGGMSKARYLAAMRAAPRFSAEAA